MAYSVLNLKVDNNLDVIGNILTTGTITASNLSGTNTGDLVSGTTIKTLNNTSLLGSGNITTITSTGSTAVDFLWSGTQAEYDAIGTKDATTIYFVV
jgi:hypothetical protein